MTKVGRNIETKVDPAFSPSLSSQNQTLERHDFRGGDLKGHNPKGGSGPATSKVTHFTYCMHNTRRERMDGHRKDQYTAEQCGLGAGSKSQRKRRQGCHTSGTLPPLPSAHRWRSCLQEGVQVPLPEGRVRPLDRRGQCWGTWTHGSTSTVSTTAGAHAHATTYPTTNRHRLGRRRCGKKGSLTGNRNLMQALLAAGLFAVWQGAVGVRGGFFN